MPSVFFSYSHADEALRDQLETQLAMLRRQGVIQTWHDRRIGAGQDIHDAIDEHINTDDIILLLISPDFIASDYCYQIEMERALERHRAGQAIVIPVILRPCDWHGAPFGSLRATPLDGKPVTKWADRDEAMLDVAKAVREAAGRFDKQQPTPYIPTAKPIPASPSVREEPRSSNLRLAKNFTQRDKDLFKEESFAYIARFFENSLGELSQRNPGVDGYFKRVDAGRFFASIYLHGRDVARCTIYIAGSAWGNGINYMQGEVTDSNSMNESLRVDADDQSLFLQPLGYQHGRGQTDKFTMEGGAEFFWDMLISPLQQAQY